MARSCQEVLFRGGGSLCKVLVSTRNKGNHLSVRILHIEQNDNNMSKIIVHYFSDLFIIV